MVGSFGTISAYDAKTCSDEKQATLMMLANSSLFVKKCLLPLESSSPEMAADKMRTKTDMNAGLSSKLVSLFGLLLRNT